MPPAHGLVSTTQPSVGAGRFADLRSQSPRTPQWLPLPSQANGPLHGPIARLGVLALALLAGLITSPSAAAQATERVSVATDGTEGNSSSFSPSISKDGRFVAFASDASNLVPGDTNTRTDVFVRDRQMHTTERVSVASDGSEGFGPSSSPSISADGRFVAFQSDATNLVPGDGNETMDIFVRDRQKGTTERVSVASDGKEGLGSSSFASISADGRCVAFASDATNLIPVDTNAFTDIPITDENAARESGVWVVDIETGNTVGFLKFSQAVQEIFAVVALAGARFPTLLDDGEDLGIELGGICESLRARDGGEIGGAQLEGNIAGAQSMIAKAARNHLR